MTLGPRVQLARGKTVGVEGVVPPAPSGTKGGGAAGSFFCEKLTSEGRFTPR